LTIHPARARLPALPEEVIIMESQITRSPREPRATADLLLWHRPALQKLCVSLNTADFAKDGSTEDQETQAIDWPAGVLQN
jgi:hypothetical protein